MKLAKIVFFRCALGVASVVLVMPTFAGNGCEKEANNRIVPELALCSTHVYNIAGMTNPTGADRSYMRDIVALKTTVMTQQMNKQYEYLETMIRRLKTQLEKAVLSTTLEAKGASGGGASTSRSVRSDDKYRVLPATENCMQKGGLDSAIACIQSNVRIVMNAVESGNVTDARKQLEKDLYVAKMWGIIAGDGGEYHKVDYRKEGGALSKLEYCNAMTKTTDADRKKATVLACSNELNVQIGLFLDDRSRSNVKK